MLQCSLVVIFDRSPVFTLGVGWHVSDDQRKRILLGVRRAKALIDDEAHFLALGKGHVFIDENQMSHSRLIELSVREEIKADNIKIFRDERSINTVTNLACIREFLDNAQQYATIDLITSSFHGARVSVLAAWFLSSVGYHWRLYCCEDPIGLEYRTPAAEAQSLKRDLSVLHGLAPQNAKELITSLRLSFPLFDRSCSNQP